MHMLMRPCHLHCMLSLLRWRGILLRLLALLWSAGILARSPISCLPADQRRLSACPNCLSFAALLFSSQTHELASLSEGCMSLTVSLSCLPVQGAVGIGREG